MEIFVTGGTGTIGRAVLAKLIARGHTVSALVRSEDAAIAVCKAGADPITGDLRDPAPWMEIARAAGTLVHMGATFDADAVLAERKLVAAIKALPQDQARPFHFVYTGGIWLYPANAATPLRENTAFAPLPAFAYSANTIRSVLPIRHIALSVIHPALVCAKDGGPIADMLRSAETGTPFATRANLDTLWPLVEVDDLADLYVRAIEARRYRLATFACGLEGVPVSTLLRLVSKQLGLRLDLAHQMRDETRTPVQDISAGYALSQRVAPSQATRLLGWRPRITRPEELVEALLPVLD